MERIQLREGTPPETRLAVDRLVAAGYTPIGARALTGAAIPYEMAAKQPQPRNLPVQGFVDRSAPLEVAPLLDTPVTDSKGNVLIILKNPLGGPYTRLPADPAAFSPNVDSRVAVCRVLSGPAAARCLKTGGYF